MRYRLVVLAGLAFLLSGCAQMMGPKTPDFFPNEQFRRAGSAQADADARECMSLADQYVKEPNKYGDMAKRGVVGGAVGAGTGAIGGVIMKGSVGRATAAGAAIGGMIGVLSGLSEMNEHTPSYDRFVEFCLQKKGYEIVGWSSK
jgi:outer membrane lipoprotein SlyB